MTTAAVQLLAAMDHHGLVLAQRQVSSKSNEIPAFQLCWTNSARSTS